MVLAVIGGLGAPELMLILVIVVVLFGAGRLAGLGRDLGQGIREFKKATNNPEEEARKRREEESARAEQLGSYTPTGVVPPAPAPASTNGAAAREFRPGEPAAPPPANVVNRPPDFTGR